MVDLAVIMSVYWKDSIDYVKTSVGSILAQTYSEFHFYIFFDGPVNKEINNYLTSASFTDSRIKLYRNDFNEGLANALNYLLKIVLDNPDYKFIARMDADDISDMDRFRKQREYLLANNKISCVGSWYHVIDESGKLISNCKMPVSHEEILRSFCFRTPVAHPSVMFHRNLIEIAGCYPVDTLLMEDTVLWGRALKQGLRFANLPEFLLKLRRDMEFYRRRSGLCYGWNYIKTRYKINKQINFPICCYLFSLCLGVIKMMPSPIIKCFYFIERGILFRVSSSS